MRRTRGFTLLEILIVMAMMGILFAIGFVELRNGVLSAQLREASTQVGQDLERVRSTAIRSSQPASFTLSADGKSYTLNLEGANRVVQVPNNVAVTLTPTGVITYASPYGEVNVASRTLSFARANFSGTRTVYVVGVTGKVVQ